MGLGTKRICQSCTAKFYDLEKDPIVCPKCGTVHNPETAFKPKRGRKKASVVAEEPVEEIEIALDDDETIEEIEDDATLEELDEEIRDEMEIGEDDADIHEKDESHVLVDIEEDSDDIIESDTGNEKE